LSSGENSPKAFGPSGADLSNEEFRLLVERSVYLGDIDATERLAYYLLVKLQRKALFVRQRFGTAAEREIVVTLVDKGLQVAYLTLTRCIAVPRNYTMRAMNNTFKTLVVREASRQRNEVSRDHGLDSVAARDDVEVEASNRALLKQFTSEQKGTTARKVAQVVELAYLLGCSHSDACGVLDFGTTESETVLHMLREWKRDPQSPLYRLIDRAEDREEE
jgi:hypothetical protein